MLRNLHELEHDKINATDGEIGSIADFYFDDKDWAVRYVVAETGSWLSHRHVLISPISVRLQDWAGRTLPVSITKAQVQGSPSFNTDKPVSRQNEAEYLGYYGYAAYWGGGGMWGEGLYPYAMAPGFAGAGVDHVERERQLEAYLRDARERHRNDDPHLRSFKAVTGYHIRASDGEIGHVAGMLVDDETWAVRYLVINTSNWWIGHKALIAPAWITGVHWSDKTVSVALSREAIKNAPAYDSAVDWGRDGELALYRYHGRRGYWAGSPLLESEM